MQRLVTHGRTPLVTIGRTPRFGAPLAAAVALAVLGAAPAALAYSVTLTGGDTGAIVRWNKKSLAYHLHPSCSSDLQTAACLDAVRASFAAWKANCADVSFVEQGFSQNLQLTSIGYGDNGKNEIAWIEGSQWTYGKYTLGVTGPIFWTSGPDAGSIFEADIALNGYLQSWSLSGANYSTDVMNVMVHEIGHYFGLQHNLGGYDESNPPTMAPTADPFMRSRTPEADDLKGLCFLQPKGSHTCASNADCPLVVDDGPNGEFYAGQLACTGGYCGGISNEIPTGAGALGDGCSGSYDCADPLFCQPLSGGSGVCAQECSPQSGNCPGGFTCVPYSNSPDLGVCLEGTSPTTGTKDNGQACTSSSECKSQLCVIEDGGQVCRQKCTSAQPCPAGYVCYGLSGVNYGACFEDAPPATGSKATGEPCQSSSECASGLCAGDGFSYLCTDPCSSSAQCPDGYGCFALSQSLGGCFKTEQKSVGETCEGSFECESDLCASIGGSAYVCTGGCGSHDDCPCGMQCVGTTSGDVCAPGAKVACVPDGASCQAGSECVSGVCDDGVCAIACSIFNPAATCPSGLTCGRVAPTKPEGVCVAPGPNSLGKPCGQDNACQSYLCHDNVCVQPCSPFGASTCGVDQVCEQISSTVGHCAPKPPPVAEPEPDAASSQGADATQTADDGADLGPHPSDDTGPKGGADIQVGQPSQPTSGGAGGTSSGLGCSGGGTAPWPAALLTVLALGLVRRRRSA